MGNGDSSYYSDNNRTLWSAAQLLSVELVNRLSRNHKRYGKDYEPAADKNYVLQLVRQIRYKQYSFEQIVHRLANGSELNELSDSEGQSLEMSLMVLQQQIDNSLSELHQQLLEFDLDRLADNEVIDLLDGQRQFWSVSDERPIMQEVISTTRSSSDSDHTGLIHTVNTIREKFESLAQKLKEL